MSKDYLTDEEREVLTTLGTLRHRLLTICAAGRDPERGLNAETLRCADAVEACNHINALEMVALNSVAREHGPNVAVLMGRRDL